MTTAAASLTSAFAPLDAGAEVVAAAFLGGTPVFALADGRLLLVGPSEPRHVVAHEDAAILVAAGDGKAMLTGGDDGRIVSTDASGASVALGDETEWIDAVALRADGTAAWSAGRHLRARSPKGEIRTLELPSSSRGIAFFPKGYRLAAAHYNGVSLWFPNAAAEPELLEWKGSHLDATVSPDGKFVMTSMQENTLHGWRLPDAKNMRMAGYPGKTRSLSWSYDGKWLATSGADACIVWPFQSKDGPMGQQPRECGVRPEVKVTRVAFHPTALVVAIGYEDGMVLLCRLTDASEILVRAPQEGARVSALAWDDKGARLAVGSENGAAGVLTLPKR
jgi:WD40 repeat protein